MSAQTKIIVNIGLVLFSAWALLAGAWHYSVLTYLVGNIVLSAAYIGACTIIARRK